MRKSTRDKLFLPDEHYYCLLNEDVCGGNIIIIGINSKTFIIHEYPDEKDGFQVYKQLPGNSINFVREAMDLPAKDFTSEVADNET